ncbi:UDP-N-acetylmuramate dehydrogenase [Marinobacter daqiaonensis]|uniref:UDP-N-acetylenolpyruvoylglucosamine reductase n=1 Tax=Marinobacter daqiaonensis TaxID=650891 RepID=A0A1I6I4T9_9GAMM|nr:UDP-N-acetylmuramate dehydrogenase [Marinobacter daqiaonensis]SFR61732.1 UDP-N-acetylmuramate dehydrogenase [Marinobacter daqiaonensis]
MDQQRKPEIFDYRSVLGDLRALSPNGVFTNIDLAGLSRWRVGGRADCVVAPRSLTEIRELMGYIHRHGIPYVVLGSSSNLMFADQGLRALGVHFGAGFADMRISGSSVWSQSGVWVPEFARRLARSGLEGGEHICGIPGTLGGLIYMNGGSQRKGIGDNIVEVTTVTPTGSLRRYDRKACDFRYRRSCFQSSPEIIVEARFEFTYTGQVGAIRRSMLEILGQRRRKFPRKLPNCGSVFVSNPAMYEDYGPPGAVIEQCGLKGLRRGGAQVSSLHANFIVNTGNATASDLLYLIEKIRTTVRHRTGYDMPSEVLYVTPEGRIVQAHEQARQMFGGSPPGDEAQPHPDPVGTGMPRLV